MRFMLRVDVEDLSGVLAVQTLAGPVPAEGGFVSRTETSDSLSSTLAEEGVVTAVMQGPFGIDLIVKPDSAGKLGTAAAGMWAFEAVRIAGRVARPGLDTDHRTLP